MTYNLYKPYRKENSEVRYINNKSNHPKIIKKNLPNMRTKTDATTEQIQNFVNKFQKFS